MQQEVVESEFKTELLQKINNMFEQPIKNELYRYVQSILS